MTAAASFACGTPRAVLGWLMLALLLVATATQAASEQSSPQQSPPGQSTQVKVSPPARPPSPHVGENVAREQYARGANAFAAHDYAQAVDAFLAANELAPDPQLTFNIGLAYDKQGRARPALRYFREYLLHAPNSEHRKKVTGRVAELERELAELGVQQVTIRSEPPGAEVTVDGSNVGLTPWTGELPAGSHEARMAKRGFESASIRFELSLRASMDVSTVLSPVATSIAAPATHPRGVAAELYAAPIRSDQAHTSGQYSHANGDVPLDSGRRFGAWPWVSVGVGTAAGLVAVGFEWVRRDAVQGARNADSPELFRQYVGTMKTSQSLARGAAIGSLALVAAGLTLMVFNEVPASSPAVMACAGNACSIGVAF